MAAGCSPGLVQSQEQVGAVGVVSGVPRPHREVQGSAGSGGSWGGRDCVVEVGRLRGIGGVRPLPRWAVCLPGPERTLGQCPGGRRPSCPAPVCGQSLVWAWEAWARSGMTPGDLGQGCHRGGHLALPDSGDTSVERGSKRWPCSPPGARGRGACVEGVSAEASTQPLTHQAPRIRPGRWALGAGPAAGRAGRAGSGSPPSAASVPICEMGR